MQVWSNCQATYSAKARIRKVLLEMHQIHHKNTPFPVYSTSLEGSPGFNGGSALVKQALLERVVQISLHYHCFQPHATLPTPTIPANFLGSHWDLPVRLHFPAAIPQGDLGCGFFRSVLSVNTIRKISFSNNLLDSLIYASVTPEVSLFLWVNLFYALKLLF